LCFIPSLDKTRSNSSTIFSRDFFDRIGPAEEKFSTNLEGSSTSVGVSGMGLKRLFSRREGRCLICGVFFLERLGPEFCFVGVIFPVLMSSRFMIGRGTAELVRTRLCFMELVGLTFSTREDVGLADTVREAVDLAERVRDGSSSDDSSSN